MATSTQQHKNPQEIQQQFDQLTPEQTLAKLTALPGQTIYEARWALAQIQQQYSDDPNVGAVVEPLARVIGLVEAFVFSQTAEMATVRSLIGSANGSSKR